MQNKTKEIGRVAPVEYDFYEYSIHSIGIGKRIRIERENFDMSREKFSELINISLNFLGQIERGERKMSINTLIKISECLHVSIDYLIYGQGNANNDGNDLSFLLSRCSENELRVIEDVIKSIIPHLARVRRTKTST